VLHEFSRNLGGALAASFRPATLDGEVATLEPAKFVHPLVEGGQPWLKGNGIVAEDPDGPQFAFLGARRERPSRRRAADKHNEFAPSHDVSPTADFLWRCVS
jgi:hypothetical protein